jgi:hypothetical protein
MLIRFATITFAASLMAGLATGCTVTTSSDDGSDSTLTIVNDESFDIDNIYISPSGWATSDDILAGVPLDNGDSITVSLECDSYDVEIIDATGTDCYISDYSLCGTDDEWDLTDSFFDECASTEPRTPVAAPHSLTLPPVTTATTSAK